MKRRSWLFGVWIALSATTGIQAQECAPGCPPKLLPWRRNLPRYFQPMDVVPSDPNAPPPTTDPSMPPSSTMPDAFASAGQGGTNAPVSFVPGMFGDLLGGCVGTTVVLQPGGQTVLGCLPSPEQAAAFKIAESESPRPQNRFYYNYNYLGNIDVNPPGPRRIVLPVAQLHRHVIAFEKSLLDGDASVGLRLPFLKIGGNYGYEANVIGDMSVILKYALINNRDTGNVLSSGLTMRLPTGEYAVFRNAAGVRNMIQSRFNDLYFQPWGGYIYYVTPGLFMHGFHSLSVPTVGADVLYMSNDLGVGYWLFRDAGGSMLQGVVPTFEVHVNTPFRNRTVPPGPGGPGGVLMTDQISLTTGVHFMFTRGTLSGAVGVPVAGLHTIEALASYTMRW